MTLYTLWIIALGLSMDAFAVSISKGLAMRFFQWKPALYIAFCFGIFQAVMPLIGFFIGSQFNGEIASWDHWIAFVLLSLIGANMIREGFSESNEEEESSLLTLKALLTLGLATSIDALAVGVSLAFLAVDIMSAMLIIGVTTFVIAIIGVKSGHFLGKKFKSKAEIFGAIILIAIGIKILFEHGVFTF